jgi:probable phosphomutase (TIGR03848 family)
MTTFYLIRHGLTDQVGLSLSGRLPGGPLNREGQAQVERMARNLAGTPIQHLLSSPMTRCQETAAVLASSLKLPVQLREGITEVDFGDWTGRSFQELENEPEWTLWNRFRSGARIPGGELIAQVQARMIAEISQLRHDHPDASLALVSHGDPIRTVLAYFLGIPLDFIHRLEVSPASVNVLVLDDSGPRIARVNEIC